MDLSQSSGLPVSEVGIGNSKVAVVNFSTVPNFSAAISQWQNLLGTERVITDPETIKDHGKNAYGSDKRGSAVLLPRTESDVQEIVRITVEHNVPIYPVSTGRNWGYGAASPCRDGDVIVQLSDLKEIRMVDEELGIVSIQPGVTQGMLADYLKANQLDFMVPVHGGGPTCSLIGNALERGYGLTPTTDHFAALNSLRAILPDGSIFRSPFHAMGVELIGSAHRWGFGPYVEGLFSQGNFGIVTEATFALQRRPEHVEAFFLRISDDRQLGELVESLRGILGTMGGNIAGVNLMNDRRVLSMSNKYPSTQVSPNEIISPQQCEQMGKDGGITAWTLAGVIHCPAAMKTSIRRELKRLLPASISRPIYMNRRRVRWARSVSKWLPIGRQSTMKQMSSIESLLDLADGIPRRVALPLAYWLRGQSPSTDQNLDPAKDGCGLIWYSPLVPMKAAAVQEYVRMVNRVCIEHQIEPLITLTSLSNRLFDSTVPILFRPELSGAVERAQACYQALIKCGHEIGCLPYRVSTGAMKSMLEMGDGSHWHFVTSLKRAIDPNGLISPGRYCPLQSKDDLA